MPTINHSRSHEISFFTDDSLYALNYNMLGVAYDALVTAQEKREHFRSKFGSLPMDFFRWERPSFFADGYPMGVLKFVPKAASWNTKVQRQMGCFIYDTFDYTLAGVQHLEGLVRENATFSGVGANNLLLRKFRIPCELARDAFDYLDCLGVNGARLMGDYTGVVADVRNSFNYQPRVMSWDQTRRNLSVG